MDRCAVCDPAGADGMAAVANCSDCRRPTCGYHLIMDAAMRSYSFVPSIDFTRANGRNDYLTGGEPPWNDAWAAGSRRCVQCRRQTADAAMTGILAQRQHWVEQVQDLWAHARRELIRRGEPVVTVIHYAPGQQVVAHGWLISTGREPGNEDQGSPEYRTTLMADTDGHWRWMPRRGGYDYDAHEAVLDGVREVVVRVSHLHEAEPFTLRHPDPSTGLNHMQHDALRQLPDRLAAIIAGHPPIKPRCEPLAPPARKRRHFLG